MSNNLQLSDQDWKMAKKLQNLNISAKISKFHAARSEAKRVRESLKFFENV